MRVLGFERNDLLLLRHLAMMSLRDRYLATRLGGAWAVLNPLMMFGLYTFVFGFVLRVRLPGDDRAFSYVAWLISGYGPWLMTVEALVAATTSVVSAGTLVRNIAFKTELLPLAGVLASLVSLVVSIAVLLVLLATNGSLCVAGMIWLPTVMFVHLVLLASVGIWLSAAAVFLRDVVQIVPTALTMVLFMSPVFYEASSMPRIARAATAFNPVYIMSEAYRDCMLRDEVPNLTSIACTFVVGVAVFLTGLRVFRSAKADFLGAM